MQTNLSRSHTLLINISSGQNHSRARYKQLGTIWGLSKLSELSDPEFIQHTYLAHPFLPLRIRRRALGSGIPFQLLLPRGWPWYYLHVPCMAQWIPLLSGTVSNELSFNRLFFSSAGLIVPELNPNPGYSLLQFCIHLFVWGESPGF